MATTATAAEMVERYDALIADAHHQVESQQRFLARLESICQDDEPSMREALQTTAQTLATAVERLERLQSEARPYREQAAGR